MGGFEGVAFVGQLGVQYEIVQSSRIVSVLSFCIL